MREAWEITREMFLSESEVDCLLEFLPTEQNQDRQSFDAGSITDRLLVESLLFSGLRNTEYCRLRVSDTIVGLGISAFRVQGTRQQDRTVYVPQSLSNLVQHYVRHVRPAVLRERNPDGIDAMDEEQPLVLNERGRPYERTGLYRRVVRILTGAGLGERASVQLLRHTYGYLAYKHTGGNLLFVQRQLGHAHPMVTSVYAQFVNEPYADLAEAVGRCCGGTSDRR